MRIFFVTVIIILNIQSWSIADDIVIEELFGVKILDDISKYADKTDGFEQEHLKGIITFEAVSYTHLTLPTICSV